MWKVRLGIGRGSLRRECNEGFLRILGGVTQCTLEKRLGYGSSTRLLRTFRREQGGERGS